VPVYIVVRFSLRNSWWTGIRRLVVPVFSVGTLLIPSNSLVLFVTYQRRSLSHCESSEPSYSMKLVEFPSHIQSNGLNLITDLIALFPLKFKFLGFLKFHAIQGTCAPEGRTMSDSGWMFLTVADPLTEPTAWVRSSLLAFESRRYFDHVKIKFLDAFLFLTTLGTCAGGESTTAEILALCSLELLIP